MGVMQKEAKSAWHVPERAQLQREQRAVQPHHVTAAALAAEESYSPQPPTFLNLCLQCNILDNTAEFQCRTDSRYKLLSVVILHFYYSLPPHRTVTQK